MSKRPWYKRFPADFINGCVSAGLSAEEIGLYAIILDLVYDRGPAPNDPKWLGGLVMLSTRRCRQVIEALEGKGKITIKDGMIDNRRAEKGRAKEAEESERLSKSGKKGAEKTAEKFAKSKDKTSENEADLSENNSLGEKGPEKTDRQARSQKPDRDNKQLPSSTPATRDPDKQALLDLIWMVYRQEEKVFARPQRGYAEPGAMDHARLWLDWGLKPDQIGEIAFEVFSRRRDKGEGPPKTPVSYLAPAVEQRKDRLKPDAGWTPEPEKTPYLLAIDAWEADGCRGPSPKLADYLKPENAQVH